MRKDSVTMTVKEFLEKEFDIDIYDDVCEELGIVFCGPCELTEEGKNIFEPIMNCEVKVWEDDCQALLLIDKYADWESKLKLAKKLFIGFAGYISEDEWNKLFKED